MIRLLYKSIFFCSAFLLYGNFVEAQPMPVDSLTKKFNYYRTHALQEKLYVHVDRTTYLTGELLWFKIYYVDAGFHRPLDISKVAYVEIMDKNNESVLQAKVELKDGVGNGSLFIPATLSSGNYVFRAYTQWMKNFNPEFYFHQPIAIVNAFVKTQFDIPAAGNKIAVDAQFFPEGGYTVAGVKSKIAFRVTDSSGKGLSCKGLLINSKNDVVAEFSPLKFGIGHFYFTPAVNESYKVLIEDEKGNKNQLSFPEIRKTGYVMSVVDKNGNIVVEVTAEASGTPFVYLFAHTRQAIVKAEGKFLFENKTQFIINKKELGEGITHLTVFNQIFQPVCERLFFKRSENKLVLTVTPSRKFYTTRELVKLTLQASTNTNVSVAVYKKDSIPSHKRQDIAEYFWLTSDLTGNIESPEYYFDNTDTLANQALDNLMLTHGWRRFNWDNVLNAKVSFNYTPEYNGHIIRGKVTDVQGNPVSGESTTLASPDRLFQMYGARSDSFGKVRYQVKDFFGNRKIFLQTACSDSLKNVKVESPFSEQYATRLVHPFQLSSSLAKTILTRNIALQVQDVYNHEQLNRFRSLLIDSSQFYGKADETYYLDDYTRFPSLEEVLREYVPGVFLRSRKDELHFEVLDRVNKTIFKGSPLVLLDGVPVCDNNRLLTLSALKIKKLEVIDREYHFGSLVFPGVIIFSTYQGDLAGFELDTKKISMDYDGLQRQREFYSPLYETPQALESRIPDQRTLLYWNASESVVDKSINIQFYTSDSVGEYEVVVEGLAKDGTAGSSACVFSVSQTGQ